MNPEIRVCRDFCKIRKSCHPVLTAEIINIAGGIRRVKKEHQHILPTWCRHYTCWVGGGEDAARLAMEGEAVLFSVTERDGTIRDVYGWAFGTSEKPTDEDKLRIVSMEGFVYSFQDGAYYATGQNVSKDNSLSDEPASFPVI